ncbi:MAG TPA: hypothetical protein VFE31_09095 [Opitutaceae bacterium]|jgi:hypothetical protein|nr:hypothetical protein [Opitutaceae bacterium]
MSMNRRHFLQAVSSSVVAASAARPLRLRAAPSSAPPRFAMRGFEFCGSGLWQWKSIDRALAVMEQLGFNTLILHQNDLPDYIVWPAAYFSADFMYARNPVRTDLTCNGRNYVREVGRRAARRNIRLVLEDKELWYPDGLIELHPELMEVKGIVCPTHPFWWEYLNTKYAELVQQVPEIAGVMVSAASRESKVSFAVRNCPCDRCRATSAPDWYAHVAGSIHAPLAAGGRFLVMRDHAYQRSEQNAVVDACSRVSPDIVVSLSNTPHDFYPTFPDNPRIGQTNGNPQWVEFDAMGQFAGLGVFPASFLDDWSRRLDHAAAAGARGVWFRADIEFVSDCSVFNSPNLLNIVGGARLAGGTVPAAGLDPLYATWSSAGLCNPLQTESQQVPAAPLTDSERARLHAFMRASTAVLEKTVLVRGLVFTDGTGQFPESVDIAFDNMLGLHQREEWEPGSSARVAPTEENLRAVRAEKQAAGQELAAAVAALQVADLAVPADTKQAWITLLDFYGRYVTGMQLCAECCFHARLAEHTRAARDAERGREAAERLAAYRTELAERLAQAEGVPHYLRRMFDVSRLDRLGEDVRTRMAAVTVTIG